MLEKYLIEWCSSTLASLKTASLFNWFYKKDGISLDDMKQKIQEMNEKFVHKGIEIEILREDEQSALIYVYRINKLKSDLKRQSVRMLLEKQGYNCDDLKSSLMTLKKRLKDLKKFPHEIGLFLDYPIEDVIGFIRNKGSHFKCCGYWKVYGDEKEAARQFTKYDKCNRIYKKLWLEGSNIMKLTVAA